MPAGDGSGDDDALLKQRWVYAAFFNRMKRAVYTEWQPSTVWKALSPAERPGAPTLTTVVRVTILPSGALKNVAIKTPSGVPALDQSGVQAFMSAAPFMNPPPSLFVNGEAAFDFSFYFETTSQSGSASPAPP